MTEVYRRQALRKHIHKSIQQGGGFVGNKYFYNARDEQTGGGIGGIFKSLFKFVTPLIKSGTKQIAIKAGQILKPHLKQIAQSSADAGERWVSDKVNKASDGVVKRLNSVSRKRRRKLDTFDDTS